MYKRTIKGWAKHWDFILLDTLCLQLSFLIAYFLRFHTFNAYEVIGRQTTYRTAGIILLFLPLLVTVLFNTMHNVLRRNNWEELKNTFLQSTLVFACIVVLLFTDKASNNASRIVFYFTYGIYLVLTFLTRLAYKRLLLRHKKNSQNRILMLVGDAEGVKCAIKAFKQHPEEGISVKAVSVLPSDQSPTECSAQSETKIIEFSGAAEYIRNEWIDEVYIACADSNLIPSEFISACSEMAVTIHQQMFVDENAKGKQWIGKIAKQPVITTSINIPSPRSLVIKRIIDLFAGALLSLMALIVLAIVSPMIKKQSPGPVLLKNERIGLNGKKFKMFTLRTMYMDAGERLRTWKADHPDTELTLENDPRFIGNTDEKEGIGAKIRKLSLDDLPKGFNVLLGAMSLVGPRAPSVAEWEKYEYRHRARLACKPGLTGLWQASGNSKTMSFEEATALDTDYIQNWSLGKDWSILWKTVVQKNQETEQ